MLQALLHRVEEGHYGILPVLLDAAVPACARALRHPVSRLPSPPGRGHIRTNRADDLSFKKRSAARHLQKFGQFGSVAALVLFSVVVPYCHERYVARLNVLIAGSREKTESESRADGGIGRPTADGTVLLETRRAKDWAITKGTGSDTSDGRGC